MVDQNKLNGMHQYFGGLAGAIAFFLNAANRTMDIKRHAESKREIIKLGVSIAELTAVDIARIADATEYSAQALGRMLVLAEAQKVATDKLVYMATHKVINIPTVNYIPGDDNEPVVNPDAKPAAKRSFIGMNAEPIRETEFHVKDGKAVPVAVKE